MVDVREPESYSALVQTGRMTPEDLARARRVIARKVTDAAERAEVERMLGVAA